MSEGINPREVLYLQRALEKAEKERNKLRAELAALKAGQGEAVAIWDASSDVARPIGYAAIEDGTELYAAQSATGVIVPRELLKEAAWIIGIYAPDCGSSEDFCSEELRALLAQSQGVKS